MTQTSHSRSRGDIEAWLTRELATALEVPVDQVDPERSFLELGLGSRTVVGISGRLQKWLNMRVSPTALFEYPTVHSLAAHLSGEQTQQL